MGDMRRLACAACGDAPVGRGDAMSARPISANTPDSNSCMKITKCGSVVKGVREVGGEGR